MIWVSYIYQISPMGHGYATCTSNCKYPPSKGQLEEIRNWAAIERKTEEVVITGYFPLRDTKD